MFAHDLAACQSATKSVEGNRIQKRCKQVSSALVISGLFAPKPAQKFQEINER